MAAPRNKDPDPPEAPEEGGLPDHLRHRHREATIKLKDAQLDVTVKGDERDDSDKTARPLAELDSESLAVLFHAVRAEMGCR